MITFYPTMMTMKLNNKDMDSIHAHHRFSIKFLVNNQWKATRLDVRNK